MANSDKQEICVPFKDRFKKQQKISYTPTTQDQVETVGMVTSLAVNL